ncbi:MAG: hypothetical protein AVDCRST_MAG87-1177 [uncultured Thermomicrobiales bacterium]|uniref:Uncharacterized protein n=1 Tax=uncultured Thermomicrobiales bacterium TaxID=1645740 RepID=A0A6J4UR55_9BACT|nr:MAG: hypothetical protein AVDCRST_MAG87-1177 [uncultured Thermomicrobiales bacterium]
MGDLFRRHAAAACGEMRWSSWSVSVRNAWRNANQSRFLFYTSGCFINSGPLPDWKRHHHPSGSWVPPG